MHVSQLHYIPTYEVHELKSCHRLNFGAIVITHKNLIVIPHIILFEVIIILLFKNKIK